MLFKSNIYIDIYKYIYFGLAQSYFIYIAYIYIYILVNVYSHFQQRDLGAEDQKDIIVIFEESFSVINIWMSWVGVIYCAKT